MPITSEGEFLKGRGLRLDRFSVNLLGRIADKGAYTEAGIFNERLGKKELGRRRSALRELIQRKIVKRDKKGGPALGEFGEGHCKWIWGIDFEPFRVREPKAKTPERKPVKKAFRKTATAKTARAQPARQITAAVLPQPPKKPTFRVIVPNTLQHTPRRSRAQQERISHAIARTHRR